MREGERGDQVFDKVAPLLLANSLICAALRWQLVVPIIGLYLLLMPLVYRSPSHDALFTFNPACL